MKRLLILILISMSIYTFSVGEEVEDRLPPASLSVEQFSEYFDGVEKAIASGSTEEREKRVNAYVQRLRDERARQYQGSVMRVTSEVGVASIGTTLNFRQDYRHVRFSIDAPINGLRIKRAIERPAFKMIRGAPQRVTSHKSKIPSDGGTKVDFHLTLAEPNANEKDVHIRYSAWVDYEFMSEAALVSANQELKPVVEFANKRIKEEGDIDELKKVEKAKQAAEMASIEREAQENLLTEVKDDGNKDGLWWNLFIGFVAGLLVNVFWHLGSFLLKKFKR